MISKIFITGKTFGETCRYVCEDLEWNLKRDLGQDYKRAQVLYVEGVREHDHRLMAADFESQHHFTPEKEKPVFHGVLSFPPGERPGDEMMVDIGRRYLVEIGMADTQFAIVKHTDKEHLHLHIVANRVNNKGRIIGQGFIIERGIKAAQKLTREYELQPEQSKNLELTHLEALHEPDQYRYRVYQAIRESLPYCWDLEDLEKRLLERAISTRYRMDPATGERQGISFRIGDYSFQGSKVDPAYSLKNLERALSLSPELKEEQRQELKPGLKPGLKPELKPELRPEQEETLKQGREKEQRLGLEEDTEHTHRVRHSRDHGHSL
jgi:hypothetical protein